MPRLKLFALAISLFGVACLAGCHKTDPAQEARDKAETANLRAQISSLDTILRESDRAQRWKREQAQWQEVKARHARARESTSSSSQAAGCSGRRVPECLSPACRIASSSERTVASILSCAREQNLPTGPTWALTAPWQDVSEFQRRSNGYCFRLEADGTSVDKSEPMRTFLVAYYPDRRIYWAPGSTGSTLEEVAAGVCARLARP